MIHAGIISNCSTEVQMIRVQLARIITGINSLMLTLVIIAIYW